MAQFEPRKQELEKAGAQVLLIAAEKRGGMWDPEKALEKNPTSFPFLLDEDRAVTKAYGLYHRFGRDAINIAHPATLIVAGSGTIEYIYRGENQHDRAPLDQVMLALNQLKQ
jgi:peroxiredoxin